MASEIKGNFKLVIAEKPDAARRIAASLGQSFVRAIRGIEVFDVPLAFDQTHYVICAAAGHLYGVADTTRIRRVYPIFDTEWLPYDRISSTSRRSDQRNQLKNYSGFANQMSRRLIVISQLANHAEQIVQACDYDIEGETIGYNIIRYACGNSNAAKHILRAKFSTLTEDELRTSFSQLADMDLSRAEAGRARHIVDFLWGINLSRAISEANRRVGKKFRNLTIGRVQGPTLAFVVDREIDVKTHVPLPFWSLESTLQKDGSEFKAHYEREKIEAKKEANEIYVQVSNVKVAKVSSVKENTLSQRSPYPFSLGDLERESFRLFKFSPSTTLSISEKLYLRALISYPRTNSQKLPPSIGYSRIIEQLLQQNEFGGYRLQLQEGKRRSFPIQGSKEDPAHPAIYPTGFKPPINLSPGEKKIYDLIARRFLALFAENAVSKEVNVKLSIKNFAFIANGHELLETGWRTIYPFYSSSESLLPTLFEGEEVQVIKVELESKFTPALPTYTPGSLLAKMESENVGTKATRAETISTLIDRDYILQGKAGTLTAAEIGLALVDSLKRDCPQIISKELCRITDEHLEKIVDRKESSESVLGKTFHDILVVLEQIHRSEEKIGSELQIGIESYHSTLGPTSKEIPTKETLIGKCPICKTGYLKVIRSQRTHKRFLGCTNYSSSGCRASSPLPQRGMIRKFSSKCGLCGWPMISIRFSFRGKGAWNFCPNISCPSKNKKEEIRA
ncbi:MAG: DNA topoisomerase I [archaeon]|nr:DNA topoisomerase I [archaeon]